MIPDDEATGLLARLYKALVEPWGGVDNILKIHSLQPGSMKAHSQLYQAVRRGSSPLGAVQREMIAVVVSALNECHY